MSTQRNLQVVKPKSLDDGLPNAIDAERVILGTLLQWEGRGVEPILTQLEPDEFYLTRHRQIYEAIAKLSAEKSPITFVSVRYTLGDEYERVNDGSYLIGLVDRDAGAWSALPYYAGLVKEKAHLRKLAAAGEYISVIAIDGADPAPEIQGYAERLLTDIRREDVTGGPRALTEMVRDSILRLEQNEAPQGITTGLVDVDRVLTTLEPGTLTIIGARPSVGKTAFGLGLGLNVCVTGKSPLFFSLEMSDPQISLRLLSMKSGVEMQRMRECNLNREDWVRIGDAQRALDQLPVFHVDCPRAISAAQLCVRAQMFVETHPVAVVIVDFLTRLRFGDKRDLRHELGDAVKLFKDLAGELNVPVIALSQLSRASVTNGKVRHPEMSDLRESGNLEEDADNVIFIHRQEVYDKADEHKGKGEVIIAKQRQGPAPRTVEVSFRGSCLKFEDPWRSELYAGH